MRLIHNALKILTTGLTALLISACGGGGSSSAPTAATTSANIEVTTAEINPEQKAVIKLAVATVDAVSALDTLLNVVGVENVVGTVTKKLVACPGGGAVEFSKTSTQIVLRPSKCIPYVGEVFLYDGTWTLPFTSQGAFNADGSCHILICRFSASTFNGTFGNIGDSKSTEPLFHMAVTIEVSGSSKTIETIIPTGHRFTTDDVNFGLFAEITRRTNNTIPSTLSMSIWTIDESKKPKLEVKGGLDRSPLTLSYPYPATISFTKTGVTANVDQNNDGIKELLLDIKWSDFL